MNNYICQCCSKTYKKRKTFCSECGNIDIVNIEGEPFYLRDKYYKCTKCKSIYREQRPTSCPACGGSNYLFVKEFYKNECQHKILEIVGNAVRCENCKIVVGSCFEEKKIHFDDFLIEED